jgi:hypothetical protein
MPGYFSRRTDLASPINGAELAVLDHAWSSESPLQGPAEGHGAPVLAATEPNVEAPPPSCSPRPRHANLRDAFEGPEHRRAEQWTALPPLSSRRPPSHRSRVHHKRAPARRLAGPSARPAPMRRPPSSPLSCPGTSPPTPRVAELRLPSRSAITAPRPLLVGARPPARRFLHHPVPSALLHAAGAPRRYRRS